MFFGGDPFDFPGMPSGMGGGRGGPGRGGAAADTTGLYTVLGLDKKANDAEIKKAYRKLALKVREELYLNNVYYSY